MSIAGLALERDPDIDALLTRADNIKTSSYGEFKEILESVEQPGAHELTPRQSDQVRYLRGWEAAYTGEYEHAISTLKPLVGSTDVTLRLRARATMANVLSLARRYEEAFSELSVLLDELDFVKDKATLDQGLAVAALLYSEVGQHNLSLAYADRIIQEDWNGRGACRGGQVKVRALYDGTRPAARPPSLDQEIRRGVDACVASGELMFANVIRTHQIRLLMERNELAHALDLLNRHYDEVQKTSYPRLISQWDTLLADLHLRTNDVAQARTFAVRAIDRSVKNEFTQPLVAAYHLLFTIEKQRGNERLALDFHEKYTIADKGHLDDISARQLAYERVKHEVAANKLQIESLKLQRELDAKTIENVRLYVVLLIVILSFIAFWAYKTKRSQLHFMNLSRRDGLTGIFNRPHFMELAGSTLENCYKLKQDVSLIVCDLDHFKQINDRYGHPEGDRVLRFMVAACQKHMRAADIFARVGGEEFWILLPACDLENARERAEELRKAIAGLSETSRATISASFGVSGTSVSGYDLHQLLAHADAALYQAKGAGRDRVVVYDKDIVTAQMHSNPVSSTS